MLLRGLPCLGFLAYSHAAVLQWWWGQLASLWQSKLMTNTLFWLSLLTVTVMVSLAVLVAQYVPAVVVKSVMAVATSITAAVTKGFTWVCGSTDCCISATCQLVFKWWWVGVVLCGLCWEVPPPHAVVEGFLFSISMQVIAWCSSKVITWACSVAGCCTAYAWWLPVWHRKAFIDWLYDTWQYTAYSVVMGWFGVDVPVEELPIKAGDKPINSTHSMLWFWLHTMHTPKHLRHINCN